MTSYKLQYQAPHTSYWILVDSFSTYGAALEAKKLKENINMLGGEFRII